MVFRYYKQKKIEIVILPTVPGVVGTDGGNVIDSTTSDVILEPMFTT